MESKKMFKAMFIYLSYFIYACLQTEIPKLIGINYYDMSLTSKIIYNLSYSFLYILTLIFIYRKTLIKDIKDYIKSFKNYKKYMDYWAIAFILMIVSNLIITFILPESVATNQEALNENFLKAPLYSLITSVLFAPFMEEVIFRLSLRNVFKNDKLFIIMSGFVFGALHVVGTFKTFADLAYIITYSIPGFIFAYTLVKSKNIFVPMSLHLFHNGFMTLIQFVLVFFI